MDSGRRYDLIEDDTEGTARSPDGVDHQVGPDDADEALRTWGLSTAIIEAAIRAGYDALNAAPKTLAPWFRRGIPAGYISSNLVEQMIERGWNAFVYGQNLGVTSADNSVGLLVWPGNDATGVAERRARNVRAKGEDSRELFDWTDGRLQLPFDTGPRSRAVETGDDDVAEEDVEGALRRVPAPCPDRWLIVLRHRVRGTRRVRVEVQLVDRNSLSSDGYLTRALLRALLHDVELERLPLENALTPSAVADPDVEVSPIDAPEDDEE